MGQKGKKPGWNSGFASVSRCVRVKCSQEVEFSVRLIRARLKDAGSSSCPSWKHASECCDSGDILLASVALIDFVIKVLHISTSELHLLLKKNKSI